MSEGDVNGSDDGTVPKRTLLLALANGVYDRTIASGNWAPSGAPYFQHMFMSTHQVATAVLAEAGVLNEDDAGGAFLCEPDAFETTIDQNIATTYERDTVLMALVGWVEQSGDGPSSRLTPVEVLYEAGLIRSFDVERHENRAPRRYADYTNPLAWETVVTQRYTIEWSARAAPYQTATRGGLWNDWCNRLKEPPTG